jgi:hypothetical protein
MKSFISFLLLCLHLQVVANMASPITNGTMGSRPFISEFVDVVHEDLRITIDNRFEFATFNVKYHINALKDGSQIPFLFYASECEGSFEVKIDGNVILIQEVPDELLNVGLSRFKDFAYFFEADEDNESSSVLFYDSPRGGFNVDINDMRFFECDITKGSHIIEVGYRASKWVDSSGWVNEYSFRYALSPAKYWKSFGTLDVVVDASKFQQKISSNVGVIKAKTVLHFDALPTEVLQINYVPEINETAKTLIWISPLGLMYITGFVLAIVHLVLLILFRKFFPLQKYSPVLVIGAVLIPIFFLASYMSYYELIDSYIGEHAGRAHGYTFFIMILYPLVLPFYGSLYWLFDRRAKKYFVDRMKG